MNNVANYELKFQSTTFHPVVDGGNIWLTSTELAKALEYADARSITKIYSRNQDEFTPAMSMVVNMTTNGINNSLRTKKVRVFSIRGAHLVGMFAETPIAKQFRRWVLDILDREVAQGNVNPLFDFELAAHNAHAINVHLKAIKEMWRGGLEDALKLMEYKHCGNISERLADISFHTVPLEHQISKYSRKRVH